MAKQPLKTYLTSRDREMMLALASRRVETLEWLHEEFFEGRHYDTARKRLGRLVRSKYIDKTYFAHEGGNGRLQVSVAYSLRVRGGSELVRCGLVEEAPTRKTLCAPAPNQIAHAIQCNRVGDWLKESVGESLDFQVTRRTETMKRASRVRADASFLSMPDERGRNIVRIEVDMGNYRRGTIARKAEAFIGDSSRHIWFVVPNQQRARQLYGWLSSDVGRDRCRDVRVYTFQDIQNGDVDHTVLPDDCKASLA